MDIGGWLRGLGLERYERVFRENEIDERVLPKLTADDLKELGIAALGHRRLLLEAIAALRTDATPAEAPPPPTAPDTTRPRPASNHKEEQMRNAGVHERCLQPAERLSSILGAVRDCRRRCSAI